MLVQACILIQKHNMEIHTHNVKTNYFSALLKDSRVGLIATDVIGTLR